MQNKKTYSIILLMSLLVCSSFALAQEQAIEKPGITPDSPILYGIDRALERIRMIFTFGEENKVNYGLKIAMERLAEIKAMHEKNDSLALEKAVKGYEDISEEIGNKTRISVEAKARVRENLQEHLVILEGVLIEIPEQARERLQSTFEKTERVREKFE